MAERVKGDKRIRTMGERKRDQVEQGIVQSAFTNDDYLRLDPSLFSFVADNVMRVDSDYLAGKSMAALFHEGDKIWIDQATGGHKYFYITDIENNDLYFSGYENPTLHYNSSTTTDIGLSRLSNPAFHPTIFNFSDFYGTTKLYNDSNFAEVASYDIDAFFGMIGAVAWLTFEVEIFSVTGNEYIYYMDTPLKRVNTARYPAQLQTFPLMTGYTHTEATTDGDYSENNVIIDYDQGGPNDSMLKFQAGPLLEGPDPNYFSDKGNKIYITGTINISLLQWS